MTDRTIAVTVAVRNVQDAIRALKGLGEVGEQELQRLVAKAQGANAALSGLDGASGRAAGAMGRFGPIMQQAGYQVGDFAVQVAAGQSALVAFAQQGGQLAGLFGPAGAIIGAILGVGAALAGTLIPQLFESGDAFDELGDRADAAARKMDAALTAEIEARERAAARGRITGTTAEFGAEIDPFQVPSDQNIAAQVEQNRRIYGSSRDPEQEREERLGYLRDLGDERRRQREQEQRDADQAQRERDRVRDEESRRRRQLEDERQRDFQRSVDEDLAAEQELQRQKRALADDESRWWRDKQLEAEELVKRDADARLRESERVAAEQRDILIEPWRDLATEVSQITTQMFDEFLEKGSVSAGDLASTFADTLRTGVAGVLGNLTTLPLQTAISQIATQSLQPGQGFGGALLGFAQANPTLTAGVAGFAGGSLASSLAGQQGKYGGLGGAIGGAAGFAIGNMLLPGVGGFIGAGLGSVGGGLVGGLFGAENNLGNDRSAQVYRARDGKIVYSDRSFSPENRNITSGILGELASLQEAFEALGGSVADFQIRVEAGNKTGITVDGVKYETAEEALRASIGKLLGRTRGLSAIEQTVLANSKGGTAQEVLGDLDFARAYEDLTFQGRDVDRTLRDLARSFAEAGRRAAELGLDVEALAEAHRREAAAAVEAYEANLRALTQRERDLELQQRAQVRGVEGFFGGLIEPLRGVNDNGLSPLAQIAQARRAFQEDLALARSGDVAGTQALAGSAQQLLGLRDRYLGSGGLGAEILREVQAGTGGVIDSLERQQREALASLPKVQRETTAEVVRVLLDGFQRLAEEQARTRRELELQRRAAA